MFAILILQASVPAIDYGTALQRGSNVVPVYRPRPRDDGRLLRERVGRMVADGDCKGAADTALRAGDFDLAERVKGACQ